MITIVQLEKYITISSIFYITLYKFYYCKKPSLVILLIVDKNSKLYFYHPILLFIITINLNIKYSR